MRKKWLALGCLLIIVLLGIWAYNVWFGTTKIAFVNFQTITMGGIAKANDNSFIKLQEVPVEELDRLSGFDMVFVNGMGLRVVEEQRQQIKRQIKVYSCTRQWRRIRRIIYARLILLTKSLCGVIWEAVEDGITRIC